MIIGIDRESFSFSLYGRNFAFGQISNISENMNRNEKESFRYESPEDLTKTTGGAVPPPPLIQRIKIQLNVTASAKCIGLINRN